jgi:hypothetical protein
MTSFAEFAPVYPDASDASDGVFTGSDCTVCTLFFSPKAA